MHVAYSITLWMVYSLNKDNTKGKKGKHKNKKQEKRHKKSKRATGGAEGWK